MEYRLICAKCHACAGHPEDRDQDKCKHCGCHDDITLEIKVEEGWVVLESLRVSPYGAEMIRSINCKEADCRGPRDILT